MLVRFANVILLQMPDLNLQQEKELDGVYFSGPIVDTLIHVFLAGMTNFDL